MQLALAAQLVVILVLALLLRVQARDHRFERENADARWQAERRELTNRVQRPDMLPIARRREQREQREQRDPPDHTQLAEVGRVVPLRGQDSDDS